MSTENSRLRGTSIHVPGRKLSDFIEGPVDLLKLDVEGAEHRILRDLLSSEKIQYIRHMVIEYHHHMGEQRSNWLVSSTISSMRDLNIRFMPRYTR